MRVFRDRPQKLRVLPLQVRNTVAHISGRQEQHTFTLIERLICSEGTLMKLQLSVESKRICGGSTVNTLHSDGPWKFDGVETFEQPTQPAQRHRCWWNNSEDAFIDSTPLNAHHSPITCGCLRSSPRWDFSFRLIFSSQRIPPPSRPSVRSGFYPESLCSCSLSRFFFDCSRFSPRSSKIITKLPSHYFVGMDSFLIRARREGENNDVLSPFPFRPFLSFNDGKRRVMVLRHDWI